MNIKNITIQNFRGFEDRTFEFDSKMNVVLGDNTTGKTTLLHAVQIALGAYLQAMTLIPGGKAYRRNFKQTDQVKKYSESNKSFLPDLNTPLISIVAEFTELEVPVTIYTITVTEDEKGTITASKTGEVVENTVITISAKANKGFFFKSIKNTLAKSIGFMSY